MSAAKEPATPGKGRIKIGANKRRKTTETNGTINQDDVFSAERPAVKRKNSREKIPNQIKSKTEKPVKSVLHTKNLVVGVRVKYEGIQPR